MYANVFAGIGKQFVAFLRGFSQFIEEGEQFAFDERRIGGNGGKVVQFFEKEGTLTRIFRVCVINSHTVVIRRIKMEPIE